jgi:TIR domain/WD domain, G-beta repeat
MLKPTGFWSYTNSDDAHAHGRLSQLRALLADELQQHIGRSPEVHIFQDVATIPPGAQWERQIEEALSVSSFIIPVVTPAFLQSEWCAREITAFSARMEVLGRDDLVFPIHYVDTGGVDPERPGDCHDKAVFDFLKTLQWTDFRQLRHLDPAGSDVAQTLEALATAICAALRRSAAGEVVPLEERAEPVRYSQPALTRPHTRSPVNVPPASIPRRRFSRRTIAVGAASSMAIAAAGGGWFWWRQVRPSATLKGHDGDVSSVAFATNGNILASGGADKTVRIWEPITSKLVSTFSGHDGPVTSVAISRDGRTLASASKDHTIRVWNIASGELLHVLSSHTDAVFSIAFPWHSDSDANMLASGSADKTIKLWDAASGRLVQTLTGHTDAVFSVAVSPDSRMLLSGSADKSIRFWRVADGQERARYTDHSGAVAAVANSVYWQTTASGGWDRTVRLWDNSNGVLARTLNGHDGPVVAIAFTPDGHTLASGSWDQTVKLWDPATGRLLGTLSGHAEAVNSIAYAPDGKILASASADKTIRLWDVTAMTQRSP